MTENISHPVLIDDPKKLCPNKDATLMRNSDIINPQSHRLIRPMFIFFVMNFFFRIYNKK